MAINVQLQNGKFPSGYCWSGPQPFADDLVALITGQISGNFSGVIVSATPPSVSDQDKAWLKTDNNGKPIGLFLFQGLWIWPNPRTAGSSEIMIWDNTEASLWSYDGGDGTDPGAVAPTATSGAMWQKATNFTNNIAMGAGGTVGQGATAGATTVKLVRDNLPNLQLTLKFTGSAGILGSTDATGPAMNGYGIGDDPTNLARKQLLTEVLGTAAAGADPTANVSILSPVRGVIYARRTSRIYYTST